jgi:hypothetical protein
MLPQYIGRRLVRKFWYSLKGQCHEMFDFRLFNESVSPKPLSIPIGPFQIFVKVRGDICSSRCTTGVVDTGGKRKNLQSENFLIFFGTSLCSTVELTYGYIISFKFTFSLVLLLLFVTGVVDTGGALSLANISANFRKFRGLRV